MAESKRPEGITDEHLEFLDALRESGVTNMFGASPYIQEEFCVDEKTARIILKYWIQTFGDENR